MTPTCRSCRTTDLALFDRRPSSKGLYARCRPCRAGAPTHKWCGRCQRRRPIRCFYTHHRLGYQGCCKTCNKDVAREWRENNPRQARAHWLKQAGYGITIDEYDTMVAKQRGRCAVCRCRPEDVGERWLSVDHDHRTGKVRSLLCRSCNTLLGRADDSVLLLKRAIRYLEAHR